MQVEHYPNKTIKLFRKGSLSSLACSYPKDAFGLYAVKGYGLKKKKKKKGMYIHATLF